MNPNSAYKTEFDPSVKWVAIREDSLKTIREIEKKLAFENISHKVSLAPGCKNGSCSLTYILMVPEPQAQIGLLVVEKYFLDLFPELKTGKDLEEQGKCPACGFENNPGATTCADCELPFIVEY